MRGLFDGDGTIYHRKDRGYMFNITSTYEQDWSEIEFLLQALDIKYSVRRLEVLNNLEKINRMSRIVCQNRVGVIKFMEYIYDGYAVDKIGFNRKYSTFIDIKNTINIAKIS